MSLMPACPLYSEGRQPIYRNIIYISPIGILVIDIVGGIVGNRLVIRGLAEACTVNGMDLT